VAIFRRVGFVTAAVAAGLFTLVPATPAGKHSSAAMLRAAACTTDLDGPGVVRTAQVKAPVSSEYSAVACRVLETWSVLKLGVEVAVFTTSPRPMQPGSQNCCATATARGSSFRHPMAAGMKRGFTACGHVSDAGC
jgi:hypothetical protein